MALANFFERALTSASAVLQGFDPAAFEAKLLAEHIDLTFDAQAAACAEGRAALDMAVRLLARLYPRLSITDLGAGGALRQELVDLALAINPAIDIVATGEPTVRVVVGETAAPGKKTIYIGSDGWIAELSDSDPVGSGASDLPFGAGAAACFAAANVFRAVFAEQLAGGRLDKALRVSLFDYSIGPTAANPPLAGVDFGETQLVGLGAIGQGAVWALSRMRELSGTLDLIDGEDVDLTNLQRYVMTVQSDDGRSKVAIAKEHLTDTGLAVNAVPATWDGYLAQRPDWRLDRTAVALDTAADRILVQAALPKRTLNAWTQAGDLGVSRHDFGGKSACLACLYMPTTQMLNEDQVIATAIGFPEPEALMDVRMLLATGQPVGPDFAVAVAQRLGLPDDSLLPFAGEPLKRFYSQAICGGVVLRLKPDAAGTAQVPLAFQSALAGVMLAAEMVVDASSLRAMPLKTKTIIDLMKPLGSVLSLAVAKVKADAPARCLCSDGDFLRVYKEKYQCDLPT